MILGVHHEWKSTFKLAMYPGLLAPAFVACSTNAGLVLQATNTGARRPGYEATFKYGAMMSKEIYLSAGKVQCNIIRPTRVHPHATQKVTSKVS